MCLQRSLFWAMPILAGVMCNKEEPCFPPWATSQDARDPIVQPGGRLPPLPDISYEEV
jgi:hypothetical protein